MEMYCSDNAGKYPRSLQSLVSGRYLAEIPTCPVTGRDTYTPSYTASANPDDYQLGCLGRNHPVATTCPEFLEISHRGDYPWHDTRADYCHALIDCELLAGDRDYVQTSLKATVPASEISAKAWK